ncbi:MAG: hypothetical protein FJ095_12175 [Deltaproteobacteria bacterium]|nr:hypothetical protein [Deltaproteobacteria bacterium]
MNRDHARRRRWLAPCAALIAAACAPKEPPLAAPKVPLPPMRSEAVPPLVPVAMPATVVAELKTPERELRFARNGERALFATRSSGRWLVGPVRLDRDGAAALAPSGLRAVHPAAEGSPAALERHGDGFILAWVEHELAGGESRILALELDADGTARGAASVVGRVSSTVSWVDLHDAGATTFVLWDATRGAAHEVAVAALRGTVATAPVALDGGRGWHAVGARDALWFASTRGGDNADAGQVNVTLVSASGAALTKAVHPVSGTATALDDVQVASVGAGAVVAWSDRRDDDLRVYLSTVSRDGKASPPRALDRVVPRALVGLAASEDGARAVIATERVGSAGGERRVLQLETLREDGTNEGAYGELLFFGAGAVPALVGDGSGFATLTLAPLKQVGAAAPSLDGVPTFVRMDRDLKVRSSEPVRIEDFGGEGELGGLPLDVRAPACERERCTVVARSADGSPLVAIASAPARATSWAPAARRVAPPEPPLASELSTLAVAEHPVVALDSVRLGSGKTLLAWLEDAPPTSERNRADSGAKLFVRALEADGSAAPPVLISDKAFPDGGLDLEALPDGGAALAWVGPNPGPQVFLTRLGGKGEKLQQRTVTRLPRVRSSGGPRAGFVRDLELAVDPRGGFLVAWSDLREGEGEIYLARVDARLERKGADFRVTTTPTASAEPTIAQTAEATLVAWSETAADGSQGDILVASFDAATSKLIEAPRALAPSRGHSRTPRFASAPGGVALAWLEDAPVGVARDKEAPNDDDVPGLRLVSLDGRGRPLAQVTRVGLDGEVALDTALTCDDGACRVLFAIGEASELRLDALALAFGASIAPMRRTVATLPASAKRSPSLSLAPGGSHAFFVDARDGVQRLRQLGLSWMR